MKYNILIIIFFFLLINTSLNSESFDENFQKGLKLEKEKKYNDAIINYTLSLEKDQKNINAYYRRANCYRRINEIVKSIDDLNKSLKLNPDNDFRIFILLDRGICYLMIDEIEKSNSDFLEALKLNPDDYAANWLVGGIYRRKGLYDKANIFFNKALKLNSNFAFGYFARGINYYFKNNYTKSIKDFQKALELKEDYLNFYILLLVNSYKLSKIKYESLLIKLKSNSKQFVDNEWEYSLIMYLTNNENMTDDILIDKTIKTKNKLCDAYCIIGYKYLFNQDEKRAKEYFQKSVDNYTIYSDLSDLAKRELLLLKE